ncbi:MAG: hypothetical protein E7284_01190 [Lachnospiraceae bacterium]|nr:hypothetical protein [Lachnospiraceae bacterium]
MRLALENDIEDILQILKTNLGVSIYMYINLKTYGLSNPNIQVWVHEDADEIDIVAMRYYTALRFFCVKNSIDTIELIAELIDSVEHKVIYTSYDVAQQLYERYKDIYILEESVAVQLTKYRNFNFESIEKATEDDIDEIATMILDDDFYRGQYTHEGLVTELLERMRTGMGRNYIIRKDGKIVVHDGIMAQTDDVAVGGLLLCHRDYRKQFLGETMESFLIKTMNDEGIELYAYHLGEKRWRSMERAKNVIKAHCGRLIKK